MVGKQKPNMNYFNFAFKFNTEYIWQAGVGFSNKVLINTAYDSVRTEILKLLLICFSETIYDNSGWRTYYRDFYNFTPIYQRIRESPSMDKTFYFS